MVKIRISETSNINNYEKNKLKKEADSLLIGKSDKSINLISNGEKIDIKQLPVSTRTGTNAGYYSVPMADGLPYVFQYGTVVVGANTTVDVVFPSVYTNRCFQVQLTLADANDAGSSVKSINRTATGFTVKRDGGTVNDIVQWFAIGF